MIWLEMDWICSKLWSKCLPFRASLWAFLSAFSWRFCLVGLSVYSYPGLEAHVCDGLSGWKKYVTSVKTLLLSLTFKLLTFGLFSWSVSFSLFKHGLLLPLACCQSTRIQNNFCKDRCSYLPEETSWSQVLSLFFLVRLSCIYLILLWFGCGIHRILSPMGSCVL